MTEPPTIEKVYAALTFRRVSRFVRHSFLVLSVFRLDFSASLHDGREILARAFTALIYSLVANLPCPSWWDSLPLRRP